MFKLLTLFALAYFIYRSLRNLVDASLGQGKRQQKFDRNDGIRREREDAARPVDRPQPQTEEQENIEDARWKDL